MTGVYTKLSGFGRGTSGLGLLGALNLEADPTRQPDEYKGLGAVCNELAGTTDLSPTDALRSINL